MNFRKIIAAGAALCMSASAFSGLTAAYAMPAVYNSTAELSENTEAVYNFSSLTDASYDKSGADVFEGAVHLSAGESMKPLSTDVKIVAPLGTVETVTSALISKKIAVQMTLAAGETMVVYYAGSDSKGSDGKELDMVVKDSAGTVVAQESNSEKEEVKPYTISYKSEAGGTYTIVDSSSTTYRTIVYAAAKTTADFVPTDPANVPPADITGFTASPGDNMVYLTWNASEGADSYSVYIDGTLESSGITDTSFNAVGLTNGTEYTFKLEAVNTAGKKEATAQCTPAEPTEAPEAFALSGDAKDKGAVIGWTLSKYAKTYDVYRDGAVIASDVTGLSYTDTGLANGTEYTYKVTAKNNYGTASSNEIKLTPEEPPKSDIKIETAKGWLETAYVEWTNPAPVDGYEVYIKPVGGEYTKLDDELVRYYGSYYRADAIGLKAGQYQMKIQAGESYAETDTIDVKAYRREGFAFDPSSSHYNKDGVGAYKTDGTLKDGAQVLYIDDTNKDTVKHTVTVSGKANEGVGLVNILALREKNGAETTPLAIRLIGQIHSPEGKNSAGYVQLKACENITLEGVGEDATTYNWSILVRDAQNVEIRNMAVMEFHDDGISLDTNNYNCWVHNCDIFYGEDRGGDQTKGDGSLDVKSGSDYCTFSYNHFWDSGKCSLCGMKADSYQGYHMTYYGNWFDHSDSRMPRVRGDQVHVYNNYFDGNSKYGVGACTGSSVFVEKNVFRNVKYPVMISQQGSDIATDAKGTFSGEDGGMIKMFDNIMIEGSQSHPVVAYDAVEAPVEFDAYVTDDAKTVVPDTVTAKKGGSKYSNFDTAASMYAYSPVAVGDVVNDVQTYAGRMENGDFTHEFNDETDDLSYERDPVLGGQLQSYKTSLTASYTSPKSYPATDGAVPSPRPTNEPLPTTDPNATPSPTPEPPKQAAPTVWNFGEAPFTVTEGEATHPDTRYFPLSGTADRYNINNTSITPEVFGGLSFKGSSEAGYQKSGKTFDDGFEGAWQLKTGSAGSASDKVFSFIPAADGSVKVYARSGSSTKTANLNIIQGTEKAAMLLVATADEKSLPVLTMNIKAGEQVKIYSDGNTGYYGIVYTSETYVEPTKDPSATTEPTENPSPTAPAETAEPGKCVKITAQYDENGRLVSAVTEKVSVSEAVLAVNGNTKVMYWDTLSAMRPVTAESTQTPADPTDPPAMDAIVPQMTSKTWTFSMAAYAPFGTVTQDSKGNDVLSLASVVDYDNIEIIAADAKKIDIDSSSKTFGTDAYTERLKLGGTGKTTERAIKFIPGADGTVEVDALHASSTGDPRNLMIVQGAAQTPIELTAGADPVRSAAVNVSADEPVYIYSSGSGINVYAVIYTTK